MSSSLASPSVPRREDAAAKPRPAALLLHSLRPHQWVKNLLVFVPFLAAHAWGSAAGWTRLVPFFLAFNFASSAGYLFNDLIDLDSDRRHPAKRRRPLASGQLPVSGGLSAAAGCLGLGLALAAWTGRPGVGLLLLYLAFTVSYSLIWKRLFALDILVLALLYTLRLVAGAAVADVSLSPWLLTLSMFLFLSLATAKRYSELSNQLREGREVNAARGYRPQDLSQLNVLGSASGYLSVLVLALYINSEHISTLYRHPQAFWALCPLLLYWISRLWLLTHRGEMLEDPVVFALKDPVSYTLAAMTALVTVLAGPR